MLTVAQYLLSFLKSAGIQRVFGVPGRENAAILFNEVEGIEFVTARVEFNAGVMAEFSGRLTLRPQAVFCTMGPGATNMVTAAASAMLNRSPMLVVSAQLEREDRYYNLTHQCVNQRAVFAPVTKRSFELEFAEDLPEVLQQAFTEMMTEPVGPVHLSIPTDLYSKAHPALDMARLPVEPFAVRWPQAELDTQQLNVAAAILRGASRVICLVGQEVVRAGAADAVAAFVRRWNIPVIVSANAKGILSEDDPLYFGSASPYMEGILGYPSALNDLFGEVDAILNIGYQYVDDILPKMWQRGRPKKVIHLSAHSAVPIQSKYEYDVELVSPIQATLKALNRFELRRKDPITSERLKAALEKLRTTRSTSGALTPVEAVEVINRHLGDGTFVTDIGYYRHHAILFSTPSRINQFFTDAGLSSFGSGLPSALAAQFLDRGAPVFLLCGDGGFHSGSCDLETAVRHRLPVVIVMLNNHSFGLIDRYQQRGGRGRNRSILGFSPVDFVRLANANGMRAVLARSYDELDHAIATRDRTQPLLVEVPLDYGEGDEFRESF